MNGLALASTTHNSDSNILLMQKQHDISLTVPIVAHGFLKRLRGVIEILT